MVEEYSELVGRLLQLHAASAEDREVGRAKSTPAILRGEGGESCGRKSYSASNHEYGKSNFC